MSRLDPLTWSDAARYPEVPGHVRNSATSKAAADSIGSKKLGDLHRRVYSYIKRTGGCTDEEGQNALALAQNTYRPRRRELELQGYLIDSGKTRLTRSGRKAVIWTITDKSNMTKA
jgi:transcription initiation factor IIE alpha subunit